MCDFISVLDDHGRQTLCNPNTSVCSCCVRYSCGMSLVSSNRWSAGGGHSVCSSFDGSVVWRSGNHHACTAYAWPSERSEGGPITDRSRTKCTGLQG